MTKRMHAKPDTGRRKILMGVATSTAISTAPMFFWRNAFGAEFTNEPTGSSVTLGFTVPQSGAFADEGADELRGFTLAVEHLNGGGDGGMINTMQPTALQGTGILGKKVEFVTADTETRPSVGAEAVKQLTEQNNAIMISGGSSSGVAIAMQQACKAAGVVFMAGLTHANATTGSDKIRNGFRHFLNAKMSDTALSSALVQNFGADRTAYYLTADYIWGYDNESTIRSETEASGWQTIDTVRTPLSQTDFSEFLTPVLNLGADTLILSHYGANAVNSLTNAAQLGLRELQVNGNDFVIAIPLFSRLMEIGAGSSCEGVYGTVNWHSSLEDAGSLAFTSSFSAKYGFPPSAAAHTCYVQTLLYADACERAGTFDPCQVILALEGHQFDGLGNGNTEYRAEDHQCFKDVPVVKGRTSPTSDFDILEITNVVPRAEIEYPANLEEFVGNLGECSNGVSVTNPTDPTNNSTGDEPSGGGALGLATAGVLTSIAAKRLIKRDNLQKPDIEIDS